jgi:hypothetical protein
MTDWQENKIFGEIAANDALATTEPTLICLVSNPGCLGWEAGY